MEINRGDSGLGPEPGHHQDAREKQQSENCGKPERYSSLSEYDWQQANAAAEHHQCPFPMRKRFQLARLEEIPKRARNLLPAASSITKKRPM